MSPAGFDLDESVLKLGQLRQRATEIDQQFTVMGRNAMIDLMSKLYVIWHAAKASGRFDAFLGNIKSALLAEGHELRKKNDDSGLLVRYIFSGTQLDHKQIHVYGRSIDVAYEKGTPADGFADLIRKTKNGFEGLRAEGAGQQDASAKQAIALSACRAEPTAAVSEEINWVDGESFQILLAIKDDGGKTSLKYVPFSREQQEAMLVQIHRCFKKAKQTPKPKKPSKLQRDLLAGFEAEVATKQARVRQLEIEECMAVKGSEQAGAKSQELEFAKQLLSAAQSTVDTLKASFGL
ncbi:MAG: hypothetical protein C0423_10260 [Methylibium sp.]|nr:hypothetical protein [Methylibium sp.]